MKILKEDLFKNSFAITIDDERYRLFQKIFGNYKMNFVKRFDGFINKNLKAVEKCALSHITLVKMAKTLDMPFIYIFEDDAYPCKDIENRMDELCKIEFPDEAQLFLPGYFKIFNTKNIENNLLKIEGKYLNDVYFAKFWGTHSIIVFKNAYDRIIVEYNGCPSFPMDVIYSNACKNIYSVEQTMFIQYNSKKSVVGGLCGYQYDGKNNCENPPDGFIKIDQLISEKIA